MPSARTLVLSIALASVASLAHADIHNGFVLHALVNGNNVQQSAGLSNDGTGLTRTLNLGTATLDVAVNANQFVAAKSALSGSGTGYAKIQSNSTYSFKLQPPAGANVKGGKLVLRVALEGTATGNADLHLVAAAQTDFGTASGSAAISDATTQRVEFEVNVSIPAFVEDISTANGDVHMHLDATSNISGSVGA